MTTRVAYRVAAVLFLSGLFHLVVFFVAGGPWEGPVSWRKPVTFGLSFGLTLATYAWVGGFLRLGTSRLGTSRLGTSRLKAFWIGLFTVASVLEVTLIGVQAWRGVPSHFNEATALDTVVTRCLTAGGVMIIVSVVALVVAAFRAVHLAPSMRLAVRAGAASLAVALAFGGLMIAERGGSWKLSHGVAMHGVLLLPLLAWLLAFTTGDEARLTRVVGTAAAGYGALVVAAAVVDAVSL
ncbi:hypothetical protein ABZ816_37645 [Actinosynnema sp. NPDC047251]|uniref:Putative membrane protein n=1 Tax=Saccharothrix espanaensis (strain ATCC 51144 / DSM 44229 / JCM 9112 / NBRC 15066 / NRRL 15764) TaxID=1179773 RepID=K0KCF8_SACES|nr:hypothetical protein [Saccharothrix espanaensis]CCH34479.1 putative membrane protein [Saccharothrix espanaensis DSM 44229]